nr:serine/threonine-protein kinase HT1-like [Ipomoea batatas]
MQIKCRLQFIYSFVSSAYRGSHIDFVYPFQKERPSVEGFGIPKDILDILNMCWEDDPLKRPEFWHVSEMIEDLLNLIDPGWDDLPAARTSGPDQAPKLCDPSSISTNLCSCCYLSVQPNPSCSCSSCSCPSCSCFPSCFS